MMPPAAPRSRTPKLSAGVGVMSLASMTGMPVAATTSAQARGKGFRSEAGVVADAEAFGGIFLLVHIGGNGFGGDAHVGKGEVVGDDAAPSVGAKLDLRVSHVYFRFQFER